MNILKWFFSFGEKYRKKEQDYANKSRKFGTSGELVTLILFTALPLLSLWGCFAVPWEGNYWILKIFCILGALSIFMVPSELMILGIVALRHRLKMKIANKVHDVVIENVTETVSGQELSEEDKQKMEEKNLRGTANRYDLAVGIIGIVASIAVVIAFVVEFFLLIPGL